MWSNLHRGFKSHLFRILKDFGFPKSFFCWNNSGGFELDFIIYNDIDKRIILAVEVDGYEHHHPENNPKQAQRDEIKNSILCKYSIPLLRLKTTGSMEFERLDNTLEKLF